MSPCRFRSHGLVLCNVVAAAMAQATLPYIPTHILTPQTSNNDTVYVLQPNSNQTGIQLLSLNPSSIDPSSPQYTLLYDDVPFFTGNEAFVPMLDSNGSITVFTGNCQASQDTSLLWSFQPDQQSSIGNGTWSSSPVNGSGTAGNVTGPGYLARGFAFGSSNSTSSEFYTFGGLCPFDNSSSQPDWVSNADYSNEMTVLTSESSSFTVQQTESSDSPIAEAGYTVTSLQKTTSSTSGGNMMEQESFLFIGGNTQNAFLNMSTIALFSLPEASWTYIPVGSSVDTGRTDLTVRDTQIIEPRSGHSAVISSDGSQVVVFGGWVGDTSTPAEPQLVILEIGEDYGGSGPWTWSTPEPAGTGTGPAANSGLFGHAMTMLAGDVMMISGGFVIPAATSKRASSTSFEANSQVYLYNLTSNGWMSSYDSSDVPNTTAGSHTGGPLSSTGEKAGLGVGVSVAAIAIVGVAYFIWSRNRWRHRRRRDQELRKLALGAERSHIWNEPGLESSYRGSNDAALRNSILENLYRPGQSHQYSAVVPHPEGTNIEGERSGLLNDAPSGTRVLRRNFSRPQYVQSANGYEDNRIVFGSGTIHPIDEQDEFETPPETLNRDSDDENPNTNRLSNPFKDPPSSSSAHAALIAASHEKSNPTKQKETSDNSSIRSEKSRNIPPPDKNERTHSDLSESSSSGISELSIQRSNFGSQRRPTRLLQSNIPILEPSSHHNNPDSGRSSPEKTPLGRSDTDSGMRWPFERTTTERTTTMDSSSTSTTSRHRRTPLEGDTLLGSRPEWSTPPESPSRLSDRDRRNNNSNTSLTWMGSIRKTLSNAKRAVLSSHSGSSEDMNTISNPTAAAMLDITSPVEFDDQPLSRRASSASVSHLRRKQGPKDWAVEGSQSRSSYIPPSSSSTRHRHTRESHSHSHSYDETETEAFNDDMDEIEIDISHGGGGGEEVEEDWDVEAAAEGRLIQITYTVPRERLRVVNAAIGDRVIGDDVSMVSRTSEEGR